MLNYATMPLTSGLCCNRFELATNPTQRQRRVVYLSTLALGSGLCAGVLTPA